MAGLDTRRLIGSAFLFGAFLLVPREFVQAQRADAVLRSWTCVARSVATGSIFSSVAVDPQCPMSTSIAWSSLARMRPQNAISPPGAPTSLSAVLSGRNVVLNWAAPVAGGAATSYLVQAGSASGLADLASANTASSVPTLTVTDVPPGTYYVRVLAQNASGTSPASNEIVITIAGGCTLSPATPTGLASTVTGSTVTLTWQAQAVGCRPTSYTIQAGSAPGLGDRANFSTGNDSTSLTATGVTAGAYYVRVIAANAGGESAPSTELQVVVGASACTSAPGAPVSLTSSVTATTMTFAWLASSGSPSGYILQFGSSPGSSNLGVSNVGNATTYSVTGVPAGTYYVRALATNACGTSPASNEVTVVVGGRTTVVTALHGFRGSPDDGSNWSTIIQGTDGNFYGTSVTGGPFNSSCNTNLTGCGIAFKITPTGVFTVLYQFHASGLDHNAAPIHPYSTLLQASDGNFYGTTSEGPAVFRMTPTGSVTFLTFLGGGAYGNLIQAPDGNFYGTTAFGGAGTCSADRSAVCSPQTGSGTVFRMSPSGTLTTLHVFSGADGAKPYSGLVRATDGSFYGTTDSGGAANAGTIFKIRSDGTFTTLYSFTGGADGSHPYASLIQGSDGNFYGSTTYGTSYNAGTLIRMTPAGAVAILHTFTGYNVQDNTRPPGVPTDGAFPGGALLQAPDGNYYGTTAGGGGLGGGTAFMITPAGVYTQLYAFAGNDEGGSPTSPLVRATDGSFYGTTQYGGVVNMGAVFKMTVP